MNASKYVNAIRSLGLQAIMQAKQGHPGMVVSAAPINYAVYTDSINISIDNPNWINRDRFVLSAGHGSMSLYPILHFCGLLTLDDIKAFRQPLSKTPGHPEVNMTPFIDATTGPLGQGVSNAVGMAIAEDYLRHQFKDLPGLIDHYTFVVVGDGDLQEGISYESMSLAGKLQLNKLIMLHDSNRYQLESSVDTVNIENIQQRVESMGWYYQSSDNSPSSIIKCIQNAKKQTNKPSFIEVHTEIGEGLSFADSYEAHGGAITIDELNNFNEYFDCDFNEWNFDKDVYEHFQEKVMKKGNEKYTKWVELLQYYKQKNPELTQQFINQVKGDFVDLKTIINVNDLPSNSSTRVCAGKILNQLQNASVLDTIILSPDVSKSTSIKYSGLPFNEDKNSNFIMVGIREFAMSGIQNGILLHRGLRCISSSFMAFSDYFKAGIRLGAISELPSVYMLTHDSVLIGSDGPTHQPIEQIAGLRSIPNVEVIRPCDEKETYSAFVEALSSVDKTYCIILSRQNLVSGYKTSIDSSFKFGGYLLESNADNQPDFTILATGSEVELAMNTANLLKEKYNLTSKIFSVPNLMRFSINNDLRNFLSSNYGLITIEASNDSAWFRLSPYVNSICAIQCDEYGYSMDGLKLYNMFGFNPITISYKAITKLLPSNHPSYDKVSHDYLEYRNSFSKSK